MISGLVGTAVGGLACQMNSYLRELDTTVVSCSPSAADASLFDVVLADSVLFPEGGGQPCDLGTINGHAVTSVVRDKNTCIVRTTQALNLGEAVHVEIDWARRRDHMQQHTGQHLLTAVVDTLLKLPTECWGLSSPFCYIQVPTNNISPEDVLRVEAECNAAIAKSTAVVRHVYPTRADVPPLANTGHSR